MTADRSESATLCGPARTPLLRWGVITGGDKRHLLHNCRQLLLADVHKYLRADLVEALLDIRHRNGRLQTAPRHHMCACQQGEQKRRGSSVTYMGLIVPEVTAPISLPSLSKMTVPAAKAYGYTINHTNNRVNWRTYAWLVLCLTPRGQLDAWSRIRLPADSK